MIKKTIKKKINKINYYKNKIKNNKINYYKNKIKNNKIENLYTLTKFLQMI